VREIWELPPEDVFYTTGKEWLLHILGSTRSDERCKIIFLLWRAWHHRNNIVHGDGKASVTASAQFIVNYQRSFSAIHSKLPSGEITEPEGSPELSGWAAPREGAFKANVDAGWDAASKNAGLGIVIRDHLGSVLFTEWRFIPYCESAEEAEMLASLEGLKHLVRLHRWPATLESDCLRVAQAMNNPTTEPSSYWLSVKKDASFCKSTMI
jgi:hypothetical protein